MTLDQIGLRTGTDKASNGHNYLQFYEKFLAPLRDQPIVLIEAGIGGYHYPDRGGESLRMWTKYFEHPDRRIVGFDVYAKDPLLVPDALILQINQTDESGLINNFAGLNIDVFIDDASHINPFSIQMFKTMFPLLKPGGIYIWEDIHTSFWEEEYKGQMKRRPYGTAIMFLQNLQTGLQADTIVPHMRDEWDGHISEMHFMRNTCVLIKRNQE